MSQKKIIFLIIVGLVILITIVGISYLTREKKTEVSQESIKIWITEGTTEAYMPLIEGFKKYAPEYSKIDITIEKQPSDADRYRTLLLSTLAEWNAPDIFMLHGGEDAILESKIELIPEEYIDIGDFDKRYDDLFQDLIVSSGSEKTITKSLKGIPLGYETLWVFYNKSLLREVPKTWDELENLYKESSSGIFPSNLWLSSTYTPNMTDILPLWLIQGDINNYSSMASGKNELKSYLNYATLPIGMNSQEDGSFLEWSTENNNTLQSVVIDLKNNKNTTLDMFMEWKIAMILGYPSLILDLEKSSKRVWEKSVEWVILTEKIPQISIKSNENIARYTYFGISKLSKNGGASLKFLQYLMTPEAQRIFLNEYPYLIPAQSEFYSSIGTSSLSSTLSRAKLQAFVPNIGDMITVFDYGIKSRFDRYLRDELDRDTISDGNDILTKISKDIFCEITTTNGGANSGNCQSE